LSLKGPLPLAGRLTEVNQVLDSKPDEAPLVVYAEPEEGMNRGDAEEGQMAAEGEEEVFGLKSIVSPKRERPWKSLSTEKFKD